MAKKKSSASKKKDDEKKAEESEEEEAKKEEDEEEESKSDDEKSDKEEEEEDKKEKKSYFGESVKEGDLLKLEMVGETIPTPTEKHPIVFQATNLEDAKRMSSFDPKKANMYTPELVMVGKEGFVLDKVNEELQNMKYGEEKELELEPEDAFGKRDPANIEKMGRRKFMSIAGKAPRLGMEFQDKQGRHGHVIRIDQGRIRVDFNHPLAGRKVKYIIKPVERLDDFQDKVYAFMERRMQGVVPDLFKLDHKEDENLINIEVPQYYAFQQNIGYAEYGVAHELQEYLDLETVNFVHSFKKPEPPKDEEEDNGDAEEQEENEKDEDKKDEDSEE